MNPHIEQDKGQSNEHEAIDGIGRGGPAPHSPGAAITGLDAKTAAVQMPGRAGREIEMDLEEEEPLRPAPQAVSPLGSHKHPTDGYQGGELRPVRALKGVDRKGRGGEDHS